MLGIFSAWEGLLSVSFEIVSKSSSMRILQQMLVFCQGFWWPIRRKTVFERHEHAMTAQFLG
jgi:hypothetical protein